MLLDKTFGKNKYAYIGDSFDDVKIWRDLDENLIVNPGFFLKFYLSFKGIKFKIVSGREFSLKSVFNSMRIHQWLKNFLIFFLPYLHT